MRTTKLMMFLLLVGGQACLAQQFFTTPRALHTQYHDDVSGVTQKEAPVKWAWNTSASSYTRNAHQSYAKHGVKAKPLSTLYFNKDTFRLSQTFEDCRMPINTRYYNPYARVLSMSPRVEYTESGVLLGASVDRSLGKNGRWGARVQTSVKRATNERRDAGSPGMQELQNVKTSQYLSQVPILARSYRLDFAEALPQLANGNSMVEYVAADGGDPNDIKVSGKSLIASTVPATLAYSPEGIAPRGSHIGVEDTSTGTAVPATLAAGTQDAVYTFADVDYTAVADSNTALTGAARAALQDKKATYWIATTYTDEIGDDTINSDGSTLANTIDDSAKLYLLNVDEWLMDRGCPLATDTRMGLGDTTLEVFYQHSWSSRSSGELSAGLSLPTAAGKNTGGNPYHVHLGNGGHLEAYAGASGIWGVRNNLQLSLEGRGGFAFSATEKRAGVFAGSLVKNIGPSFDTSVHWHWANAQANLVFTHPGNADLTGSIGYRFSYKSKESITFAATTMESWLGKTYAAGAYTTANQSTLSNTLAAGNSRQFGHTVCANFTYNISHHVSVNGGGSYVVAGQNMPQEATVHLGCVVRF